MDIKEALEKVKWRSPILQLFYLYVIAYKWEITEKELIKRSTISKQWVDKYYKILIDNNFFISQSSTDDLTNKTV